LELKDTYGEDLFAEAQLEAVKLIDCGEEVQNPPAFLIHCAWRRTQNLLDSQGAVIELMYLREMSCREAGRVLGWSSSHADRKHQAALERLCPFFEQAPP